MIKYLFRLPIFLIRDLPRFIFLMGVKFFLAMQPTKRGAPWSVSLLIASRYLQSKRKEVFVSIITVISVLGVAVSVGVLDVVLAIMTGFEKELQAKIVNSTPHILVRHFTGDMLDWPGVIKVAEETPGVESAFAYTYSQAMLSSEGRTQGLLVRGIPNTSGGRSSLKAMLDPGTNIDDLFKPAPVWVERPDGERDVAELPPLIVGHNLLRNLQMQSGDIVTLFSAQMTASPRGLIPKTRRFVIVGSYSSGLLEFESGLAYANIDDARLFFGMGEAVTGVTASVNDVGEANIIARELEHRLNSVGAGYYVRDWTEPNKPLWDALRLEKRVYYIVLLLLILVASFSIVSTMVMIVMEKGRDIAIMKTLGATDLTVLRAFLAQGSLIGLVGTALGTTIGYLGCVALRHYEFALDETVFSLKAVPVHMIPSNFVSVAVSAFLITSLAGMYPAWRAAEIKPAQALRYE